MKVNSQEINHIDTSKLSIFKSNTALAFYLAKKDKIDLTLIPWNWWW